MIWNEQEIEILKTLFEENGKDMLENRIEKINRSLR